jgi:uncharacterized iron-regulated membrane protein
MLKRLSRLFVGKLHLYLGLWFGAVFVMLGLSGSLIAWLPELDAGLNPALLRAAPRGPAESLAMLIPVTPQAVQAAIDRLSADLAYGAPMQLTLPAHARDVYVASYRRPEAPAVTRQVMLDPYSLQINGERDWGRFGLSRPLLMPTLFHLHRYLVAGEAGKTIIGISGLALLAMAFSGLVLWWPRPNWPALRRALRISHGGSWPRFHYSWHRSTGFFCAPVLAVLAFSGVYFNLPHWVLPAVGAMATLSPSDKLNNAAMVGRQINAAEAMALAQRLYPAARVSRIGFPAKPALPYEIRLRQPGELAQGDGATRVTLDAFSGKVLRVRDPLAAPAGDRFLSWLFPLHSGQAFGIGGKIFISLFGMVPLAFFVTGVLIWRKRASRARLVGSQDGAGAETQPKIQANTPLYSQQQGS